MNSSRISAPMAVTVAPATGPRKVGLLLRLGCRHDSTRREEPIRSSAPMTARTRRMLMFPRSQRVAPLTACCSTKGLIRVGIGIPNDAEFELIAVDDPYGFASATELSLFRRPLPSTNLKFLSTVMWDGRETFPGETIHFDLSHQSNSATTGHAQGADLTEQQR